MTTSEQSTTEPQSSSKVRRSKQWWQSQFEAWKNSGLSKSEYCRKHLINASSFYNWSLKLREDELASPNPTPADTKGDSFVPIKIVGSQMSGLNTEKQCSVVTVTIDQMTVRIDAQLLPTDLAPWLTELRKTLCSM